jgi:iron complex outermembrane receptor protein
VRYTDEERTWVGGTIDQDPFGASAFLPPFVTSASPFDPMTYCPSSSRGTYLDCNLGRDPAEKIDDSDWTYRAGLEFVPMEDVLLYATYSTGFKSGAFSGIWSDLAGGHRPSDKEELNAYEIGLKSLLADRRLQLNVAAFSYDYVGLQGLAFDPVEFRYGVDNIGDADIQGVEVDLAWKPVPGLDLRLGYGYLDSELTAPNPVIGNDTQVGNRLPNAPEHSLNASAGYAWRLAGGLELNAAVDARYQSEVFFNIDNNPWTREQSFTLLNARLGLAPGGAPWDLLFWIRNLTDEEYFQEAFVSSGGNVFGNVGAPRTYGVTATLKF